MAQTKVDGFEPLAAGLYLEGLAVDVERGVVWYSDVIAGGVHGLARDGKTTTLVPDRMWIGGIALNEDGCVLSSGVGGIMWTNPETGKSGWVIDKINGQPVNGINEMTPDGEGGLLFGTIDLEAVLRGEPPGPGAIYRLTVDRQVTKLADGFKFPNGIILRPDRKRFYCNDTFANAYVFDVAADLTLTNQRPLVDGPGCDGMALDAENNVWITCYRSGALTRLRPDGTPLAPVQTPSGGVTQIRFGGADMRDYYITSVTAEVGDDLAVGKIPTEKNSILYRGRSETPGMPIAPSRFKLG